MKWLRRIFGRRPVDIAGRELRKAERQLLDVEHDLEIHLAAQEYLQRRIERLELYIKTDGLDRTDFAGSAERMATRIPRNVNADFQTPYDDPLSALGKSLMKVSTSFRKLGNKNAI